MIDAIDFVSRVAEAGEPPLVRGRVTTLQLNIGKRCNLACHHCHVDAGPKRTEAMDRRGAERILEVLAASPEVEVLDLTGGAPELNQNFRFLVAGARGLGRRVIDEVAPADLEDYIDWTFFFSAWELKGKFPKIFESQKHGEASNGTRSPRHVSSLPGSAGFDKAFRHTGNSEPFVQPFLDLGQRRRRRHPDGSGAA